jgi:hypothetical protein
VSIEVLAGRSAPGSRLVVNYPMPSRVAAVGRLLARSVLVATGSRDPTAGEPRRSSWTPQSLSVLLRSHGFAIVADDDLFEIAKALPLDLRRRRSLSSGRVAVAVRDDSLPIGGAESPG